MYNRLAMMRIMLFNQSDNLYQSGLAPFGSGYVVTPSPQMADIVRRKLSPHAPGLDVVTISKFLRDELSFLKGDEVSENYRGKSELLLLLSTLWKKLGIESGSYKLFQRCFRLLTDLRSFSMSSDVLETALEHFDDKIALGTLRMHQVLNQLDIYDEHRSYFQLSEQLRSGDLPITYETERNLIFLGFDFLSGSQVDLLKSYSIRDNVIVPVYAKVYENLSDLDWLSWLDGDDVEKTIVDEQREAKRSALSGFPKTYLAKAVKKVLAEASGQSAQIVLGERHSSYEKIQQINILPSQFKSPVDILGDKINWLMEAIPLKASGSEAELETEQVQELLEKLFAQCVESQDFRGMRAAQLLKGIVTKWRELSDENEVVSGFDLKILKEALELDAPRIFQTALSKNKFAIEIKSLKELDDLSRDRLKIFCVASDFSPPKANLVQYTEGVERYLASIGPLRRAELEFVALKEKLSDAVDENSYFLVEDGLLDRDQAWKSFFDTLDTDIVELGLDFGKSAAYHRPIVPESRQKAAYSATRLQTYLDCPRKYLFKYILKLSPEYVFEDKLDALELGRLQHATIEKYVGSFEAYAQEEHEKLVDALLGAVSKTKVLDRTSLADHRLEVVSNTRRAIEELLRIKAEPSTKIRFEQPIQDKGFRGSVDCVIETEEDILLLDFKRGASSLPTQAGFKAFEKIQLWFYANHWRFADKKLGLGYICLSDPESSLIFYGTDEVKGRFNGIFEAKSVSLEKDFEQLREKYKDFESRAIQRLEAEVDFAAAPHKPKVCDFCELNKLCPRAERRA